MALLRKFQGSPRNVCYTCGSAQRMKGDRLEYVIDTGIHIEMEGNLQPCETCVTQWAQELGLLTHDQSLELKAQLFQAEASRAKAQGQATKLEAMIAKLTRAEDDKL